MSDYSSNKELFQTQWQLTYLPLMSVAPRKLTAGGHFGVLTGILKFTSNIVHKNTNCKGQRSQVKIRFAFCWMQLS